MEIKRWFFAQESSTSGGPSTHYRVSPSASGSHVPPAVRATWQRALGARVGTLHSQPRGPEVLDLVEVSLLLSNSTPPPCRAAVHQLENRAPT